MWFSTHSDQTRCHWGVSSQNIEAMIALLAADLGSSEGCGRCPAWFRMFRLFLGCTGRKSPAAASSSWIGRGVPVELITDAAGRRDRTGDTRQGPWRNMPLKARRQSSFTSSAAPAHPASGEEPRPSLTCASAPPRWARWRPPCWMRVTRPSAIPRSAHHGYLGGSDSSWLMLDPERKLRRVPGRRTSRYEHDLRRRDAGFG